MTPTGKPDDDHEGERPEPGRPDQGPPPPQWLNDGQAPGPVALLPEDAPEPGGSGGDRPEDESEDDAEAEMADRTRMERTVVVPQPEGSPRTVVIAREPSAEEETDSPAATGPAAPAAQPAPPATSTDMPAPPPFPYAQQIPDTPLPRAPEPFPYAQQIPDAARAERPPAAQHPSAPNPPAPRPPGQNPPAASSLAQSPPAPEPFPYAQEIPGTPAPQTPEPFPYAQQIPGTPAAPPASPPAGESFPYAQQIPSGPPQEAAHPAAPPPVIEEPWRTTPQGKAKERRKNIKKPLLIGVAGLAAAALVAAGGFFFLAGGDDSTTGAAGGDVTLAGSMFGANSAGTTDGRDQRLTDVAAAGSTVVAIGGESDTSGSRGQFLVSADGGRTFSSGKVTGPGGGEPPPNEVPRTVTGSAKGWVALGGRDGGAVVWASRDGRTWQRLPDKAAQSFGKGTRVKDVYAAPDGFVAIGATSRKGDFSDAEPAVWTSADGRSWQVRSGDRLDLPVKKGEVTLVTVASSGNVLLLEGVHRPDPKKPARARKVWRSEDGGGTWTESIIPVPKGSRGLMIGGGADGFLAVREIKGGGQFFSSTDGEKWTKVGKLAVSGYQQVEAVLSDDQGFAAIVGRGRDRLISRSADGRTWKDAGTVPAPRGLIVRGAALAGGQSILVGAQDGGGDTDALLSVHDGNGGDVPIDLSKVPGAVRPDLAVTALAADGGKAVAVGSAAGEAATWVSADGKTWNRARGVGAALSRPGPQRLLGVTAGAKGWLAVGFDQARPRRPLVVTSADGSSWQAADQSEVFKAGRHELVTYGAASAPAGYVVVGEDGLSAATWFSPDLKTWMRGTGVGNSGLKALPNSNRWLRSVAGGPFGFAAAGGLRDPAAPQQSGYRPAVWTSSDGKQWTLKQLPLPSGVQEGVLTQISAKDNTLVATGNGRKASGRIAIGYLSGDGGRTWKPVDLPSPDGTKNLEVLSLTATPDGFAAAGTSGPVGATDVVSWTSSDGATWKGALLDAKGLSGAGDQQITGLAVFKNALLGVGGTSRQSEAQPVLWSRKS
ncbi:hypothetical protein [Actinomadura formosensis]|uniref:hypothetical protein n=1 Tax=Actinomadura formosensis TaxID=60706 RepID=UPI003D8A4F2F